MLHHGVDIDPQRPSARCTVTPIVTVALNLALAVERHRALADHDRHQHVRFENLEVCDHDLPHKPRSECDLHDDLSLTKLAGHAQVQLRRRRRWSCTCANG
jgi:hypothetical protein